MSSKSKGLHFQRLKRAEIWLETAFLCDFLPFLNLFILSFLGEESKNTFNGGRRFNALGSVLRAR